MSFENQIKQWIQLDNQLKELNEQTKTLREKRTSLEKTLTNYIQTNNLSNNVFKCQDVRLKYINSKTTEPLTFKYLEKCLSEVIKNEEHYKSILEYIKTKREIKYVPELKRFSNN
jgi:hypothetical protein